MDIFEKTEITDSSLFKKLREIVKNELPSIDPKE